MQITKEFDVIIIGAGAAGLFCAMTAGQRGRRVLLLDHADGPGRKILISGGGRCNFTNLSVEAEHFISGNPHFCKSALSRFGPKDFIRLMDKHRISYHEKKLGQLFCDRKSIQVLHLLLDECHRGGVQIKTKCAVENIENQWIEGGTRFTVKTNLGQYDAESLVIATGGLSFPKVGATDFGYGVAKQFGLRVRECAPGLVSFTLQEKDLAAISYLAGTSADALVSCKQTVFQDAILFTHKGLSGPAILQISNYWELGDAVVINLLPGFDLFGAILQWKKEHPKTQLKNLIGRLLSVRLAQQWLTLSSGNKPVGQYNQKEIRAIIARFQDWRVIPSGTSGYPLAEVTKGGVDTDELSSKTFEAQSVRGLYFIGEVLDVTGWLGGYNFQWAWSSGHCAGLYV